MEMIYNTTSNNSCYLKYSCTFGDQALNHSVLVYTKVNIEDMHKI